MGLRNQIDNYSYKLIKSRFLGKSEMIVLLIIGQANYFDYSMSIDQLKTAN